MDDFIPGVIFGDNKSRLWTALKGSPMNIQWVQRTAIKTSKSQTQLHPKRILVQVTIYAQIKMFNSKHRRKLRQHKESE